ncbi:MAG: hypothetical protein NC541_12410 [bacterium]|nr:hypothetical protein [bacterium]
MEEQEKVAKIYKTVSATHDAHFSWQVNVPKAFGAAAQDGYIEAQESYQSLFEDTAKYHAIMSALAEVIYREMRKKGYKSSEKAVTYMYDEPQNMSMVAEPMAAYGTEDIGKYK